MGGGGHTHLESGLLHGDLAEDAGAVVRAHGLQLLLVEGEQLGSCQHSQTVDGAVGRMGAESSYQHPRTFYNTVTAFRIVIDPMGYLTAVSLRKRVER